MASEPPPAVVAKDAKPDDALIGSNEKEEPRDHDDSEGGPPGSENDDADGDSNDHDDEDADEDDGDQDSDNDGSDSDGDDDLDAEFEAAYAAAMAEAEESLEKAASELGDVGAEDIKQCIDTLEAEIRKEVGGVKVEHDDTTFGEAMSKLQTIVSLKPALAIHVAPHAITLLSLLSQTPTESANRSSTINLLCDVFTASRDSREAMKGNQSLSRMIKFLRTGDDLDRHYILLMLEQVAEEDPSSHELILSALRSEIYIFDDDDDDDKSKDKAAGEDEDKTKSDPSAKAQAKASPSEEARQTINAISTVENLLLFQRTHITPLFLAARAFDYVVLNAMPGETGEPKDSKSGDADASSGVRVAAQSCLIQISNALENSDDDDEEEGGTVALGKQIAKFSRVLGGGGDADADEDGPDVKSFLAFAIVQFLAEDNASTSPASSTSEGITKDDDNDISTKLFSGAADWLNERLTPGSSASSSSRTKALLCASPAALRGLVLSLGRKSGNAYGASAEWALAHMCGDEAAEDLEDGDRLCAGMVRNAFRALWFGRVAAVTLGPGRVVEPEEDEVKEAKEAELGWEGKVRLVKGLRWTFQGIFEAACAAGLAELVVGALQEPSQYEDTLNLMKDLMENHQKFGFYLFEAGVVPKLVQLLTAADTQPHVRLLVPGVLKGLIEAYGPKARLDKLAKDAEEGLKVNEKANESDTDANEDADEEPTPDASETSPLGPHINRLLTSPSTLPALLSALSSPTPTLAGAAASLIGDLMQFEDGTETFGYDSDPESDTYESARPACPLKDMLVTEGLVQRGIDLLKTEDGAPGGLDLLRRCCWGYKRGMEMVESGFRKCFDEKKDLDAAFFRRMYGQYESRHTGRQRRRVAEAAFKAGALDKVLLLVEKEANLLGSKTSLEAETDQDKARRRNTVEGLRVILCADSADVTVARHGNAHLPRLLAALLTEVSKPSFLIALWMLRLLNTDDLETQYDADAERRLDKMSDVEAEAERKRLLEWLGEDVWAPVVKSEEVVRGVKALMERFRWGCAEKRPERPEGADEDPEKEKEFEKAEEKWLEEDVKARIECENLSGFIVEFFDILLPHLGTLASPIAPLLLIRTSQISPNNTIFNVLSRMLATPGFDSAPLVQTLKDLHAVEDTRPSANQLTEWIESGPRLTAVLREAGAFEWMLAALEEETVDPLSAISTLGSLVQKTADRAEKRRMQEAFAACAIALEKAKEYLGCEDEWDARKAVEAVGHLCGEDPNPKGVKALWDEKAVDRVFKMVDDIEYPLEYAIGTMGVIAEHVPGVRERLTELLKSYVVALTTPPPAAADAAQSGEGKKKKKKQKKYSPRMSELELWQRYEKLAKTTPAARKAVVESGAIDEAEKLLGLDDAERMQLPFTTLVLLVDAHDEGYAAEVAKVLPAVAADFLKDNVDGLYTEFFKLIQAFVRVDFAAIVASGVIASLMRGFGMFPNVLGTETFADAFVKMDVLPGGHEVLVKELKACLAEEDVERHEQCWGFAGSLGKLLETSDRGVGIVRDVDGVGFMMRLLKHESIEAKASGATFAGQLFSAKLLLDDLRPNVIELIERARVEALQLSKRTYEEYLETAGDEPLDEDDFKYKVRQDAKRAEEMKTPLAALKI
ncbi:hypothetical protein HGRIS_000198 [Hohenbuehelia grisea]|uniref:Uncharacterized protein n=1 Tax=Hohenbuehelia grisea TaxID=104357 RepID=A0ABR3JQC1_9AGAR